MLFPFQAEATSRVRRTARAPSLVRAWRSWRSRSRSLALLDTLSDRELHDIGFRRDRSGAGRIVRAL